MYTCDQCGTPFNVTVEHTAKPKANFPNYVGKMAFLEMEREGTTDKTYSGYYNGEYYIVRQSPSTLYGSKLTDGVYDMNDLKQFALIGTGRYIVVDARTPSREFIQERIQRIYRAACAPQRGEKLQWTEHVYDNARTNIQAIADQCGIKLDTTTPVTISPVFNERLLTLEKQVAALLTKLRAV